MGDLLIDIPDLDNEWKKFNEENLGMNNLKRAALNISSKFGLLSSHRSLVLAISEERQVHETILKLVLARVNASTSLLRWAKKEENQIMKESICRLYDISLMYASVQREFAEQSNSVSTALKEILTCEVALEALRKKIKEVTEKKERLQRNASDARRKSNVAVPAEEIFKLKEEEEVLKNELDVKTMQAEIFKNTSIKNSLTSVCDAHLKFAEKMSTIFTAAKKVIDEIKDVPDHITPQQVHQQKANDAEKSDVVVELAKALHINRPISSNMTTPSSIFHVDLGQNNAKINQIKMLHKADLKKTISNPVLLSPPPGPTKSIVSKESIVSTYETDLVVSSNSRPPVGAPPPVPVLRTRSKTNEVSWSNIYATGKERIPNRLSDIINEYDEVQMEDVQGDDSFGRLYRSASDSTISSSKPTNEEYAYSEPWENVEVKQEAMQALNNELSHKTKQHSLSEPSEYANNYQDPVDVFEDKTYKKHLKYREEQIYSQPIDSSDLPRERYQNIASLFENVEYIDNRLIQETVKSKLDILENIRLTKNTPSPATKPRPKVDKPAPKQMYSSVKLTYDAPFKKTPPKPKPRPNTVLYESPSALNKALEYNSSDVIENIPKSGTGSVREMAAQMSGKIQPACVIPSMTQAKLKEHENANYQNL